MCSIGQQNRSLSALRTNYTTVVKADNEETLSLQRSNQFRNLIITALQRSNHHFLDLITYDHVLTIRCAWALLISSSRGVGSGAPWHGYETWSASLHAKPLSSLEVMGGEAPLQDHARG